MPKLHVACGSSHHQAGIFLLVQVILKIVISYFNRPSLLCLTLVGDGVVGLR